MNPKESIEIRKQMAEMHDSIIKRINKAYEDTVLTGINIKTSTL